VTYKQSQTTALQQIPLWSAQDLLMPIDNEKKAFARRVWNGVRSALQSELFRTKMLEAHRHSDCAVRVKKLEQCFSTSQLSHMIGHGLTDATRRKYKSRALKHVDRFTCPLFSPDSPVQVAEIEGRGLGIVATRDAQGTLKSLLEQCDVFGEVDFKSEHEMEQLMKIGNPCLYDGRGNATGVIYGPLALLNADKKNTLALMCDKGSSSGRSADKKPDSAVYTDQRVHARVGVRVTGARKGASRSAQKLTLKRGSEITLSYGTAYTRRVTRQQS
jgi:hypothetical protein